MLGLMADDAAVSWGKETVGAHRRKKEEEEKKLVFVKNKRRGKENGSERGDVENGDNTEHTNESCN